MMEYIYAFGLPTAVTLSIVAIFFVMQSIGRILEFKGKVVPEWMRVKKYFDERKKRIAKISELSDAIDDIRKFMKVMNSRYSEDNIKERDDWMRTVSERGIHNCKRIDNIDETLNKHSEYILSLLIESKRNTIIDFASRVSNSEYCLTKEQFNRIFKIYNEYEKIISENGLTNGEVDIAYKIIMESYEEHMCNHTFLEDMRGW